MRYYTIAMPIFKPRFPSKPINVYNEEDEIVATIERKFNSLWKKVMSSIFTSQNVSFINIQVKNSENNLISQIESNRIGFFLNKTWDITSWDGSKCYISKVEFTAKGLEIGWKLEYEMNSRKCIIKDTSIMGIQPEFYNDKGILIAECKDPILNDKLKVKIYSEEANIYEVFSICYLLYLVKDN